MTTNESDAALEAKLRVWSVEGTKDFKKTFGVMPGRWLQMEAEYGTRGACKEILKPHPDQWWMPVLTQLWEAGRLKWSAEAVALRPEFETLFTADERAVAKARLDVFTYNAADD